jgi:hypothetical protein
VPFEAFIGYLTDEDQNPKPEIAAGEPLVVEVRDLDTFERLVVKAHVTEPGTPLEGGDELWVLDWVEARLEEPWSIKVLEELDEDAASEARSDITEEDRRASSEESKKYGGKRYKGSELPDAMGQEEARKYYENMVAKKNRQG